MNLGQFWPAFTRYAPSLKVEPPPFSIFFSCGRWRQAQVKGDLVCGLEPQPDKLWKAEGAGYVSPYENRPQFRAAAGYGRDVRVFPCQHERREAGRADRGSGNASGLPALVEFHKACQEHIEGRIDLVTLDAKEDAAISDIRQTFAKSSGEGAVMKSPPERGQWKVYFRYAFTLSKL